MRSLTLSGIRHFDLRSGPQPSPGRLEVLIRVAAVGICGTDFHIYDGLSNYRLDAQAAPVPLAEAPQVLGHEFSGYVEAVGERVTRCRLGDLVLVDQVLNCHSQNRAPICEFCESGDSHQCSWGQEYGITGLPGAFAEFLVVPESNVVPVPTGMTAGDAALAEPLGCVLHALDRADLARTRYEWETSARRIRHVVILGAGPAGLLFLQCLRRQRRFDGEIFVLDSKADKLRLAQKLGGTPIDIGKEDAVSVVHRTTRGEGIQYLIEATGNGKAFDSIAKLSSRQATLLLYGAGHGDLAPGCLTPLQVMELSIVTSAGASGRFSCEHGPEIYERALGLIQKQTIDAACLVSHRYHQWEEVPLAFSTHRYQDDFIKGLITPASLRAEERP